MMSMPALEFRARLDSAQGSSVGQYAVGVHDD